MDTATKTKITVEASINAPVEKVWNYWSEPKHITKWCQASDDWHAPYAENDLRTNGKFKTTMAAKDGSMSFDFEGVYSNVQPHKLIEYTIGDGRTVKIIFTADGNKTTVTETFEAESSNPVEMQRGGWQAILDNFKKYMESN
ncbi:MAG TPA: SRPBCC family protein [Cyclobacteriaceae bacterium]|nr:SRPBCC family protein [Cyclobacteriaceae bacterium]